jgi:hypothetical protein
MQRIQYPSEMMWNERRAVKGPAELAESVGLAISLFVAASTASWVANKALDELWERSKGALRRLISTGGEEDNASEQTSDLLVIQTYYESNNVLVETWVPLSQGEDDGGAYVQHVLRVEKLARESAVQQQRPIILRYTVSLSDHSLTREPLSTLEDERGS